MTQDINKQNNYISEEGKTFVSKLDKSRIGWIISIGEGDSIDNYTEEDMTDDEIALKNELESEKLPKITEKKHSFRNR